MNTSISRNCARSIRTVPVAFFIALVCAAPPTRDTDNPTFTAERFGLAALHQLRGRVGRGNLQSYCIFISGKKNKEVMERLNVLADSNDGFYIAGEDLKRRGPGDFFGIRQSGDVLFKMGDIYKHADMLKAASDVYEKYGDRIRTEFDRSVAARNEMYGKPIL